MFDKGGADWYMVIMKTFYCTAVQQVVSDSSPRLMLHMQYNVLSACESADWQRCVIKGGLKKNKKKTDKYDGKFKGKELPTAKSG